MSLKNSSLRFKLVGGFILMAAVSAFIGIMGNINLRTMRQADWTLYQYDTELQPRLAYMAVTFQKIRVALRDFLASTSPTQKAHFLNQALDLTHSLDRSVEKFRTANLSHGERELFEQFVQALASYRDYENRILDAGKASRPQDGWAILWSDGYGNVAKIVLGSLAKIEQMKVADFRSAVDANIALANRCSTEMLLAISFALVLALAVGGGLTISITRPLSQAVL